MVGGSSRRVPPLPSLTNSIYPTSSNRPERLQESYGRQPYTRSVCDIMATCYVNDCDFKPCMKEHHLLDPHGIAVVLRSIAQLASAPWFVVVGSLQGRACEYVIFRQGRRRLPSCLATLQRRHGPVLHPTSPPASGIRSQHDPPPHHITTPWLRSQILDLYLLQPHHGNARCASCASLKRTATISEFWFL